MSPADEHVLYQTDYAAWCTYVAPRRVAILNSLQGDERDAFWHRQSDQLQQAMLALTRSKRTSEPSTT